MRSGEHENFDPKVVDDFGREWKSLNQQQLNEDELLAAFNEYFHIFPFDRLNQTSVGFDMGCGSGRWAKLFAPRIGTLYCIDASPLAVEQAKANLKSLDNCRFECASVGATGLDDASQDFGYCLGVLHHIPDTYHGLKVCADKLKAGAPFLVYLYYRFDNKPGWFRAIWCVSDLLRRIISKLPHFLKLPISQIIAGFIYWPLARISLILDKNGLNVEHMPLSAYRDKNFYFMRTDALDRFGTRLERRFTKDEITRMMREAGFVDIEFSDRPPFWVAVAIKS